MGNLPLKKVKPNQNLLSPLKVPFSVSEVKDLQDSLITWFRLNARDLPWRQNRNAYRVWISEIMLQQTQVKTVIPFYEAWMNRFKNIQALAQSPESIVLKFWEGLGYYRRARAILKCALQIHNQFNGKFPSDYNDILSLPGIGPYSAGAISNFAFNIPKPIVDGNIIRVFSRLFKLSKNVLDSKTQRDYWTLATTLLPEKFAPLWNEGLMELGALICTPKQPQCSLCPLSKHCLGYLDGIAESLPVRLKKEKIVPRFESIFVIRKQKGGQEEFLLKIKEKHEWMEGTWTFPSFFQETEKLTERQLLQLLKKELSLSGCTLTWKNSYKYAVTHHHILAQIYFVTLMSKESPLRTPWQWLTVREMNQKPLASVQQKVRRSLSLTEAS